MARRIGGRGVGRLGEALRGRSLCKACPSVAVFSTATWQGDPSASVELTQQTAAPPEPPAFCDAATSALTKRPTRSNIQLCSASRALDLREDIDNPSSSPPFPCLPSPPASALQLAARSSTGSF
ncbi:hypothetical protein HBH79_229800 [Parastagonospora nodorum]|nr:hypothetical protein HBH46_199500 [Parastagonospora nodorum]KAH4153851.1 hypothetical protein HBH43_221930 [Parastagonospora nodorum]KAH4360745.1 hypothetical protein HBH94_189230 [Parastagonospora nodorum]KAH4376322.1 hypothetical protein HBH99_213900 [Parastagonospora nodorum]KAH4411908.1 hypothetical protein HBH93_221480 [Parastagonospora nodorum]